MCWIEYYVKNKKGVCLGVAKTVPNVSMLNLCQSNIMKAEELLEEKPNQITNQQSLPMNQGLY